MAASYEKTLTDAERLQRAILVYALEEVSRAGSLEAQAEHVASFGITTERLLELAECRELLNVVDLEALATLLNVTSGQLVVRAQRAQLLCRWVETLETVPAEELAR